MSILLRIMIFLLKQPSGKMQAFFWRLFSLETILIGEMVDI